MNVRQNVRTTISHHVVENYYEGMTEKQLALSIAKFLEYKYSKNVMEKHNDKPK